VRLYPRFSSEIQETENAKSAIVRRLLGNGRNHYPQNGALTC
jgi:hypothetical protein